MTTKKIIKIGTRGSKLALIQTEMVMNKLAIAFPDYIFEKVEITTKGDTERIRPIYEFGGKAVFVDDIENAIRSGVIDLAVHSSKDMPNPCGEGLGIAGVLERANPKDVLIFKKENPIDTNKKIIIGTSSLRREYQIKKLYPNASCANLRGNIGTRINKLKAGEYDAIILAAAGIERQGLNSEPELIYQELSIEDMLPAAGQGIIAIEALIDSEAFQIAAEISDKNTEYILTTERRVLSKLGASCHEPVGVYVTTDRDEVSLELMKIVNEEIIRKKVSGKITEDTFLIDKICK